MPEKKDHSAASKSVTEEPVPVVVQGAPPPASLTNNQAFVQNLRNFSNEGKMSGLFDLLHASRPADAGDQMPADAMKRN